MSWEAVVTLDADKPSVGSARVVWTDPVYGTFTYSRRADIAPEDRDRFVAEAIAARDAWLSKKQAEEVYGENVLTAINVADPEVV